MIRTEADREGESKNLLVPPGEVILKNEFFRRKVTIDEAQGKSLWRVEALKKDSKRFNRLDGVALTAKK